MNDELLFSDDDDALIMDEQASPSDSPVFDPWLIAIIDDDQQVHDVTVMALQSFVFAQKKLKFIHAYSAQQGIELFKEHNNIAVCLLDVVMESEYAGLEATKIIRETLNNHFTRIVLRTGQPGQAPEEQVISNYDINDYKEKTELTRNKLMTLMYSCLRSYRDIIAIEQNRQGLERVIEASANIFSTSYLENFAHGVLQQVSSILQINDYAFYGKCESLAAKGKQNIVKVIAGTGRFERIIGENAINSLPKPVVDSLQSQQQAFLHLHKQDYYLCSILNADSSRNILYLKGISPRADDEAKLLNIFSKNVLIAFENLYLKSEVENAQKELLTHLQENLLKADIKNKPHHILEQLAILIAQELALPEQDCQHVKAICSLFSFTYQSEYSEQHHNLQDSILQTKLDALHNCHHLLIHDQLLLLKTSNALKQRDEYFDGTGKPEQLAGDTILIETRIAQVTHRLYDLFFVKKVSIQECLTQLSAAAGKQFDPKICAIINQNSQKVSVILNAESNR